MPEYMSVAELRAKHYGHSNLTFLRSPKPDGLPSGIGEFDAVILSAVYEHLLPNERSAVLSALWANLKPDGVLFVNQLPHRYFPFEAHTTGLPLINYLPEGLALGAARRLSKRTQNEGWEDLLRKGIRGGTESEILRILRNASAKPVLLEPRRLGIKDRIDLWYRMSSSTRLPALKRGAMVTMRAFKRFTGVTLVPTLSLAIRKTE